MQLNEKMKMIRKEHNESQEQIAKVLSITQQSYNRYEQGSVELPVRHLKTLCKHWKISADYLLDL